MEGHGVSKRLKYEADIREPYMGNTIPVQIWIRLRDDKIEEVEVGTEEGGKRTCELKHVHLLQPLKNYDRF